MDIFNLIIKLLTNIANCQAIFFAILLLPLNQLTMQESRFESDIQIQFRRPNPPSFPQEFILETNFFCFQVMSKET